MDIGSEETCIADIGIAFSGAGKAAPLLDVASCANPTVFFVGALVVAEDTAAAAAVGRRPPLRFILLKNYFNLCGLFSCL
jgi:hypothetical protein